MKRMLHRIKITSDSEFAEIRGEILNKQRLIFFTGAGISADSNIPTFQEQSGIRDKLSRMFANEHPEEYKDTIRLMLDSCEKAEPNAAHKAIAELGCPVITMNVDELHTKAGSKNVIEVHGKLPTRDELEDKWFPILYKGIVLYGDLAPRYEEAIRLVKDLQYENSYFVIVGTSFYTGISEQLYEIAKQKHSHIIIINNNAIQRVPEVCSNLKTILGVEM